MGLHLVCAEMTEEFLRFSVERGNDLVTPNPMYEFPGLKPGDRWCLCVQRWQEAFEAGVAPRVDLDATPVAESPAPAPEPSRRAAVDPTPFGAAFFHGVEAMRAGDAHAAALAFEAERTAVLDREAVAREADARGIVVVGVPGEGPGR